MILTLIATLVILYQVARYIRWRLCKPDFRGKRVFITGGSSGIGEALTKHLLALGAASVTIASRKEDEMARV